MIRRASAFLLLLVVLATACTKTTSDDTVRPTSYRIDNIVDIELKAEQGYSTWLLYDVAYLGPFQETVTISFEDLPPGIIIDTNTEFTALRGYPPFTAGMYLEKTDTINRQGTYNIKMVSTGSITGRRSYDIHLKVLPPDPLLLGGLQEPCKVKQAMKDSKGYPVEFNVGKLNFHGFDGHYWVIQSKIACNDSITIPLQDVGMNELVSGKAILTVSKTAWTIKGTYTYDSPSIDTTKNFLVQIPLH